MHSTRGRRVSALSAVLFLVVALTIGSAAAANPAQIGAWSAPFEEGGFGTPQCQPLANGELVCKPTAVSIAQLVNGKIMYFNGIEGSENFKVTAFPEAGKTLRDSQARILDLTGGSPQWTLPYPVRGPSGNDAPYYENLPPDQALLGEIGAPGRPGDGLIGSTFGQLHAAPPVAPPNDPYENDADMFCADLTQLRDGRILIAGGTDAYSQPNVPYDTPTVGGWGFPELEGIRNARLFNPSTGTFQRISPMKYGRWYPTLVTLPNGDVWVASGVTKLVKDAQASQVRRTETLHLGTMTWQQNYTGMASENSLPLFARMHLMPNGKIFYSGVGQMNGLGPTGWALDEPLWALQQFFNLRTKQWEVVGPTRYGVRGGAFSIMLPLKPPYDRGTLIVGGGTLGSTPSSWLATPFVERITVDNKGKVTNGTTGNLKTARWFGTPVLLPDGKVALFSGANVDEVLLPGLESAVREAEMYDPSTGTWSSIGSGARDRTYHNSAILLPDGRVLVGGHSPIPFLVHKHMDTPKPLANNHKDPSFEIYSPPYLFRGPRPVISYSPSGIDWGSSFRVDLGGDYDIGSVTLIRLAAQTHTMASDLRSVELAFTQSGRSLTVTAPPNGITAPPGPYYLFVNRKSAQGPIPSVAAITTVGQANAAPAIQPMGDVSAINGLFTQTAAGAGGLLASEPSKRTSIGSSSSLGSGGHTLPVGRGSAAGAAWASAAALLMVVAGAAFVRRRFAVRGD